MAVSDHAIAVAQIALSVVFITGYFLVLALFLLGYIETPDKWRDMLTALLGVITGSLTTIIAFWFSRARPSA